MERLLVCLLLTRPWARFRSDFFSGFVKQRMICNAQLIAKSGSLNDVEQNVGSCKFELPSPLHKSRDLKRYVSHEMVLSPIVPMTIIKSFIFQATNKLPQASL